MADPNADQYFNSAGVLIASNPDRIDFSADFNPSFSNGRMAIALVNAGSSALDSGKILVGDSGNVAVARTLSGDVTINNTGVTAIASGVIVNADINASAAIDLSKLAAIGAAKIIVGAVTTGTPTAVDMSGNATISNTGAVSVTGLTIASQAAGDILYFNGTNWVRLAKGTAGQTLKMNGGATAPEWVTV